jgi:hypothetical protein
VRGHRVVDKDWQDIGEMNDLTPDIPDGVETWE